MKQFRFLTILAFGIMLMSCNSNAQNNQKKETTSSNKIEVIDFHSTHRCMTCNAIEANTVYTLETYFSEEMKSGKVTFQTINIDEKKNYDMAEEFEAAGTSLFLNVVKDGKGNKIDLTEFAFAKGREKKEFSDDLKLKIEKELKKL